MDLSVVIPVYQEVENVGPLYRELREVLSHLGGEWEVIFVDDGSTDGTFDALADLQAEDKRIRLIRFRANAGQTAALDAGFKAARGEAVVTMDGDLQNDPRDIPALLALLDSYDAVCGWRWPRRDPWTRRVSSRIANAVRNVASGNTVHDTGCTLKAFRRQCLTGLRLYRGMHRFLPTLLTMDGRRVAEVKVTHRPRLRGRSKYGMWDRLFVGLADLWAVRWMKKRRLRYEIEVSK
jgi:glycosyltransferase involved in cell wall biosynthesis